MATTIWSSCICYIIMSTLSCHVYYDQNAPYWVSIGLLTCTSHLTAITFHQVRISNSHGSPKINFTALKEEAPKNIHKLIWIKTSFFEKLKVKVHWWWPLTLPLWDILDNYTKWKRILRATSGENCRSKVNCAQSYDWLSAKGVSWNKALTLKP